MQNKSTTPIRVISAIQEAFIATIPYVVISSLSIFLYQASQYIEIDIGILNNENIQHGLMIIANQFPIISLLAISYYLAVQFNTQAIISIVLATSVFLSIESIFKSSIYSQYTTEIDISDILAIITPLITTSVQVYFIRLFRNLMRNTSVNPHLRLSLRYIFPFSLSFICSLLLLTFTLTAIVELTKSSQAITIENRDLFFVLRTIGNHVIWFFGVHGQNIVDAIISTSSNSHQLFDNMSYIEFYDLYVIFGGSGAGLAIIAASFIAARDSHTIRVAKLALPFAIFNINEILIFGIPIVFNRFLLIPFITAPIVNIFIAYNLQVLLPVNLKDVSFAWTTPIFLNSYIAAENVMNSIIIQAICLVASTMVYIPFIRRYSSKQSSSLQRNKLIDQLDLEHSLGNDIGFISTQAKLIKSHEKVEDILNLINDNELMIYYQPKVDIQSKKTTAFEALLRMKLKDGRIVGPYFLSDLEDAGLAPYIDIWVCKAVIKDMMHWQEQGMDFDISVNIHPNTLGSEQSIDQILDIFKHHKVTMEVIERDTAKSEMAMNNIKRLSDSGFKISIDDFGIGYSSYESLILMPVDSVKLDKSLIDIIHLESGFAICKNISTLCQDLHYQCVAEGVETVDQLELVRSIGINIVQGFIYSKAISADKVIDYYQQQQVSHSY